MNADGTGRRKLVDLREVPLPEGQTRSGSFVWSSDGTRLAYALETFEQGCSHLTLHVVEVASGQVTPVLTGKPLGQVQLLTWSSPRDELTFASVCDEKASTPEGGRLLGTLHLPTGIMRTRPAWNPVVSTDGTRAFISGEPVPQQRPTLVRVDETFTVEHLLKAPSWGHLLWYHQRPAGLFTAKTPERPQLECQGMTPLPQSFYRLEAGTQTLSLLRQEATALRVLDFSPDDTQALVYILIGRDESSWGVCGAAWSQRLYLVRRDELESELPVHELLARGIALAPASFWPGPTNTLFIGWLR
ncbi:hypothetical protein BO221_31640 [Archangium sp. Cb G35]|uniref:hypothetical protein n=1 Tax=Archangium sp. Cb G35 TaxID=1920190 RepID=UPI000936172F|nr:hypothetical protein [Archangium sp. Cb G35]OJT20547.1 hypothetical protein BO221_31640 [Archangium sp. Cb G35]